MSDYVKLRVLAAIAAHGHPARYGPYFPRVREDQIIGTLHEQYVREILKGEVIETFPYTRTLSNPAMGDNMTLNLTDTRTAMVAAGAPYALVSTLSWTGAGGLSRSHVIRVVYAP